MGIGTVVLEFPMTEPEGTDSPYWLILDPTQMMKPDVYHLSSMITGPFFSREEAKAHLAARRYAFGRHAVVFCASGYWSSRYRQAWREAEAEKSAALNVSIGEASQYPPATEQPEDEI